MSDAHAVWLNVAAAHFLTVLLATKRGGAKRWLQDDVLGKLKLGIDMECVKTRASEIRRTRQPWVSLDPGSFARSMPIVKMKGGVRIWWRIFVIVIPLCEGRTGASLVGMTC